MRQRTVANRMISLLLASAMLLSLTSCGTILYPERRGQIEGRIDPGVAVLDAIGLLFFIVPGLVAFGVDFTTGAIYLPGGKKRKSTGLDGQALERIVAQETGVSIDFTDSRMRAYRVADDLQLAALLAMPAGQER